MNYKKVLLCLGTVLLLSSFSLFANGKDEKGTASAVDYSNADPLGAYDETVTIKLGASLNPADTSLPAGDTMEDNYYTRAAEKQFNIDIQYSWVVADADFEQKVGLSIASNDLPDAFVVPTKYFLKMADNEQLADLTQVYDAFGSDSLKKIITSGGAEPVKTVTFDGKLLGIPSITAAENSANMMWIRQDWLDKLGLEVPTNIEELETVLKAFKAMDPANVIGIAGQQNGSDLYQRVAGSGSGMYGLGPVFQAFQSNAGYFVEKAGKATYGTIEPETKEALKTLQRWYREGLIDPEIGVRKHASEPIVAGKVGVFFGPWWSGYDPVTPTVKSDRSINFQCYPGPLAENGTWYLKEVSPVRNVAVVNKNYAHPELAIKLLNFQRVTQAEDTDAKYGREAIYRPYRHVMTEADSNKKFVTILHKVLAGEMKPTDISPEEYLNAPAMTKEAEAILETKLDPVNDLDIQYWNIEGPKFNRLYSLMVGTGTLLEPHELVYSLTYNNTATMEKRWSNLLSMEETFIYKVIIGDADVDAAFDEFVAQWKAEGGEQILNEISERFVK